MLCRGCVGTTIPKHFLVGTPGSLFLCLDPRQFLSTNPNPARMQPRMQPRKHFSQAPLPIIISKHSFQAADAFGFSSGVPKQISKIFFFAHATFWPSVRIAPCNLQPTLKNFPSHCQGTKLFHAEGIGYMCHKKSVSRVPYILNFCSTLDFRRKKKCDLRQKKNKRLTLDIGGRFETHFGPLCSPISEPSLVLRLPLHKDSCLFPNRTTPSLS